MHYRYYERWKVILLVCLSCTAVAAISFAVWLCSYRFSFPAEETERVTIFARSYWGQEGRELTAPEEIAALCEALNGLRVRRVLYPDGYFVDGGTSYLLLFQQKDGSTQSLRVNPARLLQLCDSSASGEEAYLYAASGPDIAETFFERAQPVPAPR